MATRRAGGHWKTDEEERLPAVSRVQLKNYRSIAGCDVALGRLSFLVGPNGSGKSNFVDALRLTTEALRTSLDNALRDRGGIQEVRRRSTGHPTHFGVRILFRTKGGKDGVYRFEVGALKQGGFDVRVEECSVGDARYLVRSGVVQQITADVTPPASADRLYLVTAAGLPPFREVFDILSRMGFYSLNPDQIRAYQHSDPGEVLARDGRNLPSVLERLAKGGNGEAHAKQRIERYLSRVVPGIEGVETRHLDALQTLEFRQRISGQAAPWRFGAINMSDGTLRALGTLVALFQPGANGAIPIIAIEEPEIALHPAAAGVLLDALMDASLRVQVVVTSHSPDLLDSPLLDDRQIIAVAAREGLTELGPIDEAGRIALKDKLYTAGELLRQDQIRPDPAYVGEAMDQQPGLFDPEPR